MIVFEKKLYNRVFLQKVVYKDIWETFKLTAQLAIRVMGKSLPLSLRTSQALTWASPILQWIPLADTILVIRSGR
jgi:hypothetical protein